MLGLKKGIVLWGLPLANGALNQSKRYESDPLYSSYSTELK